MRSRRPRGLRTAKLPLSPVPGRPSGVTSYADQNEASPSLGAAKCETAATFAGSWEEWCQTQARMQPRRPSGLRIAKLLPSGLLRRPSGMVSHAVQNEASPSLRAANGENATTFAGSWEAQRGGVIRRPERNLPVPGGCELRNCRHFWVVLGGPAQWCHTQIRMRPRRPWGLRNAKLSPRSWAYRRPSGVTLYADQNEASPSLRVANCETDITFVGSWEVQRSDTTRTSE